MAVKGCIKALIMYKDKNKQREANRQAQAKFKAKGITNQGITSRVLPEIETPTITEFNRTHFTKLRTAQGNIRVSKPGDTCSRCGYEECKCDVPGCSRCGYEECKCETGKRGKDIKCFADLPLDVQETIDRMSSTTEEHIKRTEAAINYQHLFPDRYHSTGAA